MGVVAARAGVSLATVDRVLNARGPVRADTRDHVLRMATAAGYAAAGRPAVGRRTFDVVLPGGTNSFLNLLADEIGRAAAAFGGGGLSARVHRVEGFDPHALASRLDSLGDTDGVGLVALDHPQVRDAIRRLRGRDVPVATVVSDMAGIDGLGYVGIDNRASGRLAAQLLGRLVGPRAGAVLLFAGSRCYRGHEEREIGFRHLLDDDFPGLTVVGVRNMRDDNDAIAAEAARLLREQPDVVGIYNVAGGNRGIAAALEAAGVASRIVFVVHELTPTSRALLTSGVVDVAIDQDPAREARALLRLLVAGPESGGADRRIRITPFLRENLP